MPGPGLPGGCDAIRAEAAPPARRAKCIDGIEYQLERSRSGPTTTAYRVLVDGKLQDKLAVVEHHKGASPGGSSTVTRTNGQPAYDMRPCRFVITAPGTRLRFASKPELWEGLAGYLHG